MGVFELVSIAKEYKAPIGWMVVKTLPASTRANRKKVFQSLSTNHKRATKLQKTLKKKKKKKKSKKLTLYAQLDHGIPRTF
jgi:uncharacterized membrane protein